MRVVLNLAIAGCAPWLAVRVSRREVVHGEWGVWVGFAVYLVVMFGWCAWYARWITREGVQLDALERDLE